MSSGRGGETTAVVPDCSNPVFGYDPHDCSTAATWDLVSIEVSCMPVKAPGGIVWKMFRGRRPGAIDHDSSGAAEMPLCS
jgi:hypothetical protein